MKGGVVAIARDEMEHPLLQSSGPATKKEAWWWLNANAVYRDLDVDVGKGARARRVHLKRGQLCHSLRFIANAWGWKDHVAVSRFLNTLCNAGWIALAPENATGQTVITICNYGEFSREPRTGATADEPLPATEPATADATNKKEHLEEGLEKEKEARSSSEPRARARAPSSSPKNQVEMLIPINGGASASTTAQPRNGGKRNGQTRIPADWSPSRDDREYAQQRRGWDDQRTTQEAEDFRNHFISKGEERADWSAAWRSSWIANDERYGHRSSSQGGKPGPKDITAVVGKIMSRRRMEAG